MAQATREAEQTRGVEKSSQDGDAQESSGIGAAIEAILLVSDRPVAWARLAEVLGGSPDSNQAADVSKLTQADVRRAIEQLNATYETTGRSFRIESVAGGFKLMTSPRFAGILEAFRGSRARASLSKAAVETLAIVAYKQPITRADLEAIRGVGCGEILRSLIDRRLVTMTGRAEEPGRPMLYGTTKQFLELFGLSSLKDLPSPEELRGRATGDD